MAASVADGSYVAQQLSERPRASGLLCPWCQGGRTGERSLLAWRDGLSLRAKCKRAKCNRYGAWDVVEVGLRVAEPGKLPPGKRYVLNTLPLADATVERLGDRYRLAPATLAHFGLRQAPGARAVYSPVYGPLGKSRGWVRRWLDGSLPKVKGYPSYDHPEGAPWQAWFRASGDMAGTVVCVEDVFSAMRLWEVGVSSVALLGVSITEAKVAELRNHSASIVVALDVDAFSLAISKALRFHTTVRHVEPDIKDMTEEQLTTWTRDLFSSLRASCPEKPAPQ